MPRTQHSPSTRARHKKWIKRAKGYRGRRNRVFKLAKEAVLKAGQHAYRDRRKKKNTFRAQWQTVINAAARQNGTTYAKLTHSLRQHEVTINRKMLARLAQDKPEVFSKIVATVQKTGKK